MPTKEQYQVERERRFILGVAAAMLPRSEAFQPFQNEKDTDAVPLRIVAAAKRFMDKGDAARRAAGEQTRKMDDAEDTAALVALQAAAHGTVFFGDKVNEGQMFDRCWKIAWALARVDMP